MKNLKLTKGLITLSSAALVAALTVALPATAQAADTCAKTTVLSGTKSVSVEKCNGTDGNNSKYQYLLKSAMAQMEIIPSMKS